MKFLIYESSLLGDGGSGKGESRGRELVSPDLFPEDERSLGQGLVAPRHYSVRTNLYSIRVLTVCQYIKQVFIAQEIKSCKYQPLCFKIVLKKKKEISQENIVNKISQLHCQHLSSQFATPEMRRNDWP